MRDFYTVMKDMTVSSVHSPTAIGNEKSNGAKDFKASLAETNIRTEAGTPVTEVQVEKRDLHSNGNGTSKSPFKYDPNALGSLRPDQVPRFFGALTDSDKLPQKEVKLSDLFAMQDRVDPEKVEAIRNHGTGGKLAVVVQHNGAQYIADGHHRLTADWLDGKESVLVRHKDLEPVDHALKRSPDLECSKILKIDEGEGIVYGWAVVSKINGEDYYDRNIDHAGQHAGKRVPENIPESSLAKCALGFVDAGAPGNEMHAGPDRGDFPFVMPMTTELFKGLFGLDNPPKTGLVVGHRPPPDVLQKFKTGEYTGFSIEGARLGYTEHSA
jgi:hypothetical protein